MESTAADRLRSARAARTVRRATLKTLPSLAALGLAVGLSVFTARPAHAFCGFFVGKADTQLFNKSSQVAIVRDGDRTVLTLANDFKGALTDFALVVPVPAVLEREQIHVGDPQLLKHLDDYSAPRLVEYHDPDPCPRYPFPPPMALGARSKASGATDSVFEAKVAQALGVKVEAEYTVGEYDIVLLSAKESNGLETWLLQNGYRIPRKAALALAPYVRQEMKFFVAKVNLKEHTKAGFQGLRPLQIAFDSPRFMLPIRLGMANAEGPQDLIVYALTRSGRVESTNYQTAKVPSDVNLPESVQGRFGPFYEAAFARSVAAHDKRAVLTEYAWNMASCDPCSAQPLSPDELRRLGVFWLDGGGFQPGGRGLPGGMPIRPGVSGDVMLTRLHVRYDAEHFPEDLMFQVTGDRQTFQARYVMNHPFRGDTSCEMGREYLARLRVRRQEEARTLAELTGWDLGEIRSQMGPDPAEPAAARQWWKNLWQP
jgi:hypothetical protein